MTGDLVVFLKPRARSPLFLWAMSPPNIFKRGDGETIKDRMTRPPCGMVSDSGNTSKSYQYSVMDNK